MKAKDIDLNAVVASIGKEEPAPRKRPFKARCAKTTRQNILKAAREVFSRKGYEGARIEKISKAAKSYDSLIYYYFGSKEKLFVEVLEGAYRDIFEAGQNLPLDENDPEAALRQIIEFPFRYYMAHPEVIVLLGTENLHAGKHISKSSTADQYALPMLTILQSVIDKGIKKGVFRKDVDCEQLYMAITSLGYFYVSNRHTFSAFMNRDLLHPERIEAWAHYISTLLLDSVRKHKTAT